MTDAMDELATSLFLDRVPKSWEMKAYPSQRPLGGWLADLHARIAQVVDWSSGSSDVPMVTWISGLFNPQSFLTGEIVVCVCVCVCVRVWGGGGRGGGEID